MLIILVPNVIAVCFCRHNLPLSVGTHCPIIVMLHGWISPCYSSRPTAKATGFNIPLYLTFTRSGVGSLARKYSLALNLRLKSNCQPPKKLVLFASMKVMKNAVYFMLKTLLVLNIFKFLSWLYLNFCPFCHLGKRLTKNVKVKDTLMQIRKSANIFVLIWK